MLRKIGRYGSPSWWTDPWEAASKYSKHTCRRKHPQSLPWALNRNRPESMRHTNFGSVRTDFKSAKNIKSLQNYLGSNFNLVAIDKDHAVLARTRCQEGDALRVDVMHRSGRAGHAVAGMRAGDQWRTVQHENRKEDEKRRRSGANQNEASTRQVPSIAAVCRSPRSAEQAGIYWFLARWNTVTGMRQTGPPRLTVLAMGNAERTTHSHSQKGAEESVGGGIDGCLRSELAECLQRFGLYVYFSTTQKFSSISRTN